ncbi:MAG: hypothetical protein A2X22_11370 [Bacteroidetes bacterium GWF2_49_14]|nr:MAG: hypothetical protein A2X22_11370 [Bacteroidetes bacterium GWF2_49_14]HBB90750.1 hypothetical protein [Bacteroidales bacterium]
MKNKHLLFALALVLSAGFTALAQSGREANNLLTSDGNQTVKDLDPMNAANWLNARRVNQYSGTIDIADLVKAQDQVKALTKKGGNSLNMAWQELGPNNVGGRTRAFLIDKDNSDVCFAGSVSGGLWKTTTGGNSWEKTLTANGELFENLAVSSICQASNGDIYYGTGEGPAVTLGDVQNQHQGILGQGIWKSVDHGNTFARLESTWSTTESKQEFVLVYALAADPTNASRIYAATVKGLRLSTDGGQSWTNPIPEVTTEAGHVAVGSNGAVLASVGKMAYRSTNGDPGTFTKVSSATGLTTSQIVDKDISRMTFAFAPSDPNFAYCLVAGLTKSGTTITGYPLSNIYQSIDGGVTWAVIGPGGSGYFSPLGSEGNYASALGVDPSNPGFIMIGGKDVFSWSYKTGWERVTLDEPMDLPNRGFYVHRDQHTIVFSNTDPNTVYIGTSGGVAVSNNKGRTWRTLNKNYNVTQFLTVAYSPKGEVLGGSMDNGILYIDFKGNDPMYANWWGGQLFDPFISFRHGGDCEISTLDPNYKFYTTPGGSVHRRFVVENQSSYQGYYPVANGGTWLSPMALWESYNDPKSWDSVMFIADRDYNASETIIAQSMIRKYPLAKTLTAPLLTGDTVKVQDTYQALIAFGKIGQAGIKANRHPLSGVELYRSQFYSTIERTRLSSTGTNIDNVIEVTISADGNNIFSAVWDASEKKYLIYRNGNFENARDRKSMDTFTGFDPITGKPLWKQTLAAIGSFSQVVTSITVDPTNPDNVIVTCGNYGNTDYIYLSTTATTAKDSTNSFVPIQGNLPQAPIYSAIFNWRNHNEVIVGTEYGVYSTSNFFDANPVWASENNNGMEILPVFQLKQQRFENSAERGIENHGEIYAATFGRGLFKSETFATKGGASSSHLAGISTINVQVTPNPVADLAILRYSLESNSDIEFQIYDLQGKMVKSTKLTNQPAGNNEFQMPASDLGAGTYLVRMISGGHLASAKFVVK